MTTLGVQVAGPTAYLAVVDDEGEVLAEPVSFAVPDNMPRPAAVLDALETLADLLARHGITEVAVLDAQPTAKPDSYAAARRRTNVEFLIELAAARAGIPFSFLAPATVSSRLGLPDKKPADHVGLLLRQSGTHWAKRGPAGLAALAAARGRSA